MKRNLGRVFLGLLVLLILSGCAQEGQGTAPIHTQVELREETAPVLIEQPLLPVTGDWFEPQAVDDSGIFHCEGDLQQLFRDYVDRWVENGEILDMDVRGIDRAEFGWICFTGTPKQELGWKTTEYQGKECFCRGLFLRCLDEEGDAGEYRLSRSIAVEPLKLRESFIITEAGELLQLPRKLPALQSAELYVPQLRQSFVLTDPEALSGLEKAFTEPEFENFVFQEKATLNGLEKQDSFLPLYLHYTDGSSSLALAAGDGSDCCLVWNEGFSSYGPVSLFERFGVPLPSPGYTHYEDGSTTIEELMEETDPSLQLTVRHETCYTFDPDGRLIRYEHSFRREDGDFDSDEDRSYYYRPDGKPEHVDVHWEGAQSGTHDKRESYVYNDLGQVTRFASNDLNDETQGMYYDYIYDEQNRLIAIIYHYRDGREGLPSGNAYFWYDDAGLRHAYGVDQDGNLVGGPENDAGDHPIRR